MDLIKQMVANRVAQGITTNAPPQQKAEQIRQMQKTKTLRQRRQDIIDTKPKPKIVLEYFEDLIRENLESSDEDDA
jgi:hypothetical protein